MGPKIYVISIQWHMRWNLAKICQKGYTVYFITSSAVLHLLGGSGISVMQVGHLTRITFVGPGFGILSKHSLQMRCPSLHWYILHTGKSRHTGHRYIFSNVARSRRPAGALLVFPIFQILLMFMYKICYTLSWPRRKRKLERLGLQQADRDYTTYHARRQPVGFRRHTKNIQ